MYATVWLSLLLMTLAKEQRWIKLCTLEKKVLKNEVRLCKLLEKKISWQASISFCFILVPSNVSDLTTLNTSSTSLLAKWSKPLPPNGVITKYEIIVKKEMENKITTSITLQCRNLQKPCPYAYSDNKEVLYIHRTFFFKHLFVRFRKIKLSKSFNIQYSIKRLNNKNVTILSI